MLRPDAEQRGMEAHGCQRIVFGNAFDPDLRTWATASRLKAYAWLAAIRSKSPRSTASSLPVRQLPFMSRTSGDGSLR